MTLHPVDVQKIAKTLSKQIQKETKSIKSLLPEYNTCHALLGGVAPMTMKEALDPHVIPVTKPFDCNQSKSKRDVIQSFILMKRAAEEVDMPRNDMEKTVAYYSKSLSTLLQIIQSKQSNCTLLLTAEEYLLKS